MWANGKNIAFVAISSKDQRAEREKSFSAAVGQLDELALFKPQCLNTTGVNSLSLQLGTQKSLLLALGRRLV